VTSAHRRVEIHPPVITCTRLSSTTDSSRSPQWMRHARRERPGCPADTADTVLISRICLTSGKPSTAPHCEDRGEDTDLSSTCRRLRFHLVLGSACPVVMDSDFGDCANDAVSACGLQHRLGPWSTPPTTRAIFPSETAASRHVRDGRPLSAARTCPPCRRSPRSYATAVRNRIRCWR